MTMSSPKWAAPAKASRRFGEALIGVSAVARSGFALVLGSVIASGAGMVFWALCARMLSPEALGVGVALISAMVTLSHASQLNLRNLLHRFLPVTGAERAKLINRSYGLAAATAILLGTGFATQAPTMAPALAFLAQSPLVVAGFVAGLVIWTLYSLQEAVLTALRLSAYVPLQNLVHSVAKIACFSALAFTMTSGTAIMVAWVAPALLIGLASHTIVSRRLSTKVGEPVPTQIVGRREITNFFGWDYLGTLATSISLGAAPLLVVSLAGAAEVAVYYLAWSLTYFLYLVSRHVGAAMLAEIANNMDRRRSLYAETIVLTVLPVAGGMAGLVLFAPQVMMIFGPHYVDTGVDVLRILAIACLPGSLVTAYLAICRAEGWVRMIALLQVTILAAVLAIGGPLTAMLGPIGMAWGWLAANSLAALLLGVVILGRNGALSALDFAIDVVSAAQRLFRQLARLLPSPSMAPPIDERRIGGHQWILDGKTPTSLSDASVERLVNTEGTLAILKLASTAPGRASLRREHAALNRLRGDSTASIVLGPLLPQPLHFEDGATEAALLMSELPGADARTYADRPAELVAALSSVVAIVSDLHCLACKTMAPAPTWRDQWIDAPLSRIASEVGGHSGISRIADELRAAWSNSHMSFGIGHGDFCPDNLLVVKDSETGELRPSGLIDWGGLRFDSPRGVDPCTMALTLRSYTTRRQLGQVVLDMLRHPAWSEMELKWLTSAGTQQWMVEASATRTMVLLTWLQHVDANLGKSARYTSKGYWGLANIGLVVEGLARAAP